MASRVAIKLLRFVHSARTELNCLRGVFVSGVRLVNEANARRTRLVLGRVTVSGGYVTSQLGQLSLASLRGRLIEYQLRLG